MCLMFCCVSVPGDAEVSDWPTEPFASIKPVFDGQRGLHHQSKRARVCCTSSGMIVLGGKGGGGVGVICG